MIWIVMTGVTLACKIVLLGDGRVGKTSLRRTYLGQNFSKSYNMTIGADFAAHSVQINDDQVTANIWDLSGQTKFKIMRETYYRGVSGAILVYDITRRQTFDNLQTWINELISNNKGKIVPTLIVANKTDLRGEEGIETISTEEGQEFTKSLGDKYNLEIQYVEASARTGENVETAFETLIVNLYEDFKKLY